MKRGPNQAVCKAHGRIAAFGDQLTSVELGGPGWLVTDGPIGPRPISVPAADLLDLATVVYRIERQLQKRSASNPNVKYELTIPLRDPQSWRERPSRLLEELLGFLGNTVWEVNVVSRPRQATGFSKIKPSDQPVRRVALLSGGLDSACGAGAGLVSVHDTQLCSFYTRQKALQADIAADLDFPRPTQWRQQGSTGPGRSFYYRSFLFLALAAATAETWGAREVVQFENGILASAIPPVPSLAMTRHAHPKLHQLFVKLVDCVLTGRWCVVNPLWQMTKREAVHALEKEIGNKRAAQITSATQSCWNLSAPHVFGVRTLGPDTKHANEQCGVCIPCIIRRTALPREHFAFDLRRNGVRNHAKLGAHFLEYVELLSAVRAARTTAEFRTVLPAEALDLIDDGWVDLNSLERLFRQFAKEFFDTFF
jgi:7-cyano-7-deazaguanine synthase in queuosine biosynthesis